MTSLTLAIALGCGGDQVDPAFEVPPEDNKVVISPAHVVARSDYESSIGNMVEIYGTNFPKVRTRENLHRRKELSQRRGQPSSRS